MHIYDDIKKAIISCIECCRVYCLNKRKNVIRISLVFVFQTFFSTVVFVVTLSHIIFIGHVRARVVYYLVIGWWGSLANIPTQINTSNLSMRLVSNIPRNFISLNNFRIYQLNEIFQIVRMWFLSYENAYEFSSIGVWWKILQS